MARAWRPMVLGVLASCGFELQPEDRWDPAPRALARHEVMLSWDYELKELRAKIRGNGVILHSSRERGTYVLANWHVVCSPLDPGNLPEGTHAEGPVGPTVTVSLHRNARLDSGGAEWQDHSGTIVFGRLRILGKSDPGKMFENPFLDVALVRLETGHEPLRTATLAPSGTAEPGKRGFVRGISYHSGKPYTREVLFVSEGAFVPEGEVASGSGVYNEAGELVGSLVGWRKIEKGEVRDRRQGDREVLTFNRLYYFVPMKLVRKELDEAGFAFLFSSSK